MDIWGPMAQAAQRDQNHPMSLILDAWDIIGDKPATRAEWTKALHAATQTYEDLTYFYELNPALMDYLPQIG